MTAVTIVIITLIAIVTLISDLAYIIVQMVQHETSLYYVFYEKLWSNVFGQFSYG